MADVSALSAIQAQEETDAIRLSWNLWPNSKLEATKCVVPFAAIYSPNKPLPSMPVLPYEPIPCKQCGAILNPYSHVDYASKVWTCPFCHTRNHFPHHYQGITDQNLPAELYSTYTTIEYTLPKTVQPPHPPLYLFVVDTCVTEDELAACKANLLLALQSVPEYVMVGLITYGTHVFVHELGFLDCIKSYVFRGGKEYTTAQITEQLGFSRAVQPRAQPAGAGAPAPRKFIARMADCEFQLTQYLEELQKDAYATSTHQRPTRCTGTALQVATALLASSVGGTSGSTRIMLFVGGPATEGAGKVVARDLSEEIRSHKDLQKDAAPYYRAAKKFYDRLAGELVQQGTSLDVFACAVDQIGMAELKEAIQQTGGVAVQTDTFHNPIFKDSLLRIFRKENEEGFLGISSNGTFEVIPSRDIKVSGLLGHAARLDKKNAFVADTEIGQGGTTQWKLCSLDFDTSLAVYFEIVATNKGDSNGADFGTREQFYLQFVTKYLHYSGEMRCRVTTVARYWVGGSNPAHLISGFDQEAASVVMARLAMHKMESEEDFDTTRWLDRSLIRLCSRFGDYRKDDPQSFTLCPELQFYPQFMFNLRRSQFVQVFGNSPDETAYNRMSIFKVNVPDAMVMIQPQLYAYHFNGHEPVLLDVSSIAPDRILLLDAYFHLVVYHGTTIAQWKKAEYHKRDEHAAFAQLLELPQMEAQVRIKNRFPVPRLVDCDQNGSQARFLTAKLNPSSTYNTATPLSSEVINTDDVSLQVFTEHLKRLAVQS